LPGSDANRGSLTTNQQSKTINGFRMEFAIIIVHVVAALGITGLVLIQHGKGADMGASFGSGASQTIFGSAGSGNALTKSTSWLAIVFFVTSLGLAILARQQADQSIQNNNLIENTDQLDAIISTQQAQTATSDEIPVAAEDQLNAALDAVASQVVAEGEALVEETVESVEAAADAVGTELETAVEEAVENLPEENPLQQ
jgi:preprotein translocase subunit SecG